MAVSSVLCTPTVLCDITLRRETHFENGQEINDPVANTVCDRTAVC